MMSLQQMIILGILSFIGSFVAILFNELMRYLLRDWLEARRKRRNAI